MWLFSSSSPADIASSSTDEDHDLPVLKDEESSIETPQKSYSAMHTNTNSGDGSIRVGDILNGTPPFGEIDKEVNATNGAPLRTLNPLNGTSQTNPRDTPQHPTAKNQRGIIYFRPIQPSDRTVIQTLHEQWFPVDYKSDFFDTLCSERKIMPGGALGPQPLYCCVACFKELSDDEFEDRLRRRRGLEERRDRGSSRWSFWRSYKDGEDVDDDDDDSLLYELDNSRIDDHGRDDFRESSHQDSTSISNGSIQSQQLETSPINGPKNNDDAIESGESVFSIHHCRERERMERFYANGFRFDSDDNTTGTSCGNDCNIDSNGDCHGGNEAHRNSNQNSAEEGSYFNDNGERIIGCIVGSFLNSTLPSTKHRSTLDEKIGRDETAQLLVPDSDVYTKMFYIMTLGTSREFRRCGLGSVLVNRVVDMIEQREMECGALYLHVITFNAGAIRLYERLGFMKVKEIKDYYTINSVNYDCYLYARYFHGNRGHRTTFDVLYGFATTIIRKLGYAFIHT